MSHSVTVDSKTVVGDEREHRCTVNIDSYDLTNGEEITPSEVHLTRITAVIGVDGQNTGFVPQHDGEVSNPVIRVYEAGADGAALDETADTTAVGDIELVVRGK